MSNSHSVDPDKPSSGCDIGEADLVIREFRWATSAWNVPCRCAPIAAPCAASPRARPPTFGRIVAGVRLMPSVRRYASLPFNRIHTTVRRLEAETQTVSPASRRLPPC